MICWLVFEMRSSSSSFLSHLKLFSTPKTKSEACCVSGHFFRQSWTCILHFPTFPLGDVVEHARHPVRKEDSQVRLRREFFEHLHRRVTKTHLPFNVNWLSCNVVSRLEAVSFQTSFRHLFPNFEKHKKTCTLAVKHACIRLLKNRSLFLSSFSTTPAEKFPVSCRMSVSSGCSPSIRLPIRIL